MQHSLDRLDGGGQALECAQQRFAQAALDPDLVASTAKGHDRLLSPFPAAAGRVVALPPPSGARPVRSWRQGGQRASSDLGEFLGGPVKPELDRPQSAMPAISSAPREVGRLAWCEGCDEMNRAHALER